MIDLNGTIYSIDAEAAKALAAEIQRISDRVELLRSQEILTQETLLTYYGAKKFEQIAESNALEGSTLSVGETELAVMKGITITGHDPAYTRDAIALGKALERLTELAHLREPTNLSQLKELHGLILGGQPGAGQFRTERVTIRGAAHTPPRTWQQVMTAMERWESWSRDHSVDPALVRATVLHAWLTNIHPFRDGNGRTARAIGNLELVRAGYPPIIIRKKERGRYLDALAKSDEAGDLAGLFDLMLSRVEGALTGLEQTAKSVQGYDPASIRLRQTQEQRLQIWNASVELLYRMVEHQLDSRLQAVGGRVEGRFYNDSLDFQDYLDLCSGKAVNKSWCFSLKCLVPGVGNVERLAWAGYRTPPMKTEISDQDGGGPSIFWSRPNPEHYPPWIQAGSLSPRSEELTTVQGQGDTWFARSSGDIIDRLPTSELAVQIAEGFLSLLRPAGAGSS
jgi:Fic family protein